MKLKSYIYVIMLLFMSNIIWAQLNETIDPTKNMLYGSHTLNNAKTKVFFSWIPSNLSVWEEGRMNGYKIVRITKSIDGVDLDFDAQMASKKIVKSNVQPHSESKFTTKYSGDEIGLALRDIYYSSAADMEIGEATSLADALKYTQQEESKLFLTLMITNRKYDYARSAGLGFSDSGIQSNARYAYYISLNDCTLENMVSAIIDVDIPNQVGLEAPSELKGIGGDQEMLLSWKVPDNSPYMAYDIYRKSGDGGSFELATEEPFIPFYSAEYGSDLVFFKDSLDNNDLVYRYKVRGRNQFGQAGPFSEVIEVKGLPPRMDIQLDISGMDAEEGQDLTLYWEDFPNELESSIDHFNILRLVNIGDQPVLMNADPINASERSFIVVDPLSEAYYILEAIDVNGHRYRSTAFFGQIADTTPPVQPIGLSGEIRSDGLIKVTWSANPDIDINGYLIQYSNDKNGGFTQVTNAPLRDTSHQWSLNIDIAIEKIFIEVIAVDHRFNQSIPSEKLELMRPDVMPPAKPIISLLKSSAAGVKVSWVPSGSEDVVYHVLQRKISAGADWEEVVKVKPEMIGNVVEADSLDVFPIHYIDSDLVEKQSYDYRFIAVDDVGNQSSSGLKSIEAFDSGIRGEIGDYAGGIVYKKPDGSIIVGPKNDEEAKQTIQPSINNPKSEQQYEGEKFVEKYAHFKWRYKTYHPNTLSSFVVYKREVHGEANRPESEFILVSTIPINPADYEQELLGQGSFFFEDPNDLEFGKTYEYKLMAKHDPDGCSDFSGVMSLE